MGDTTELRQAPNMAVTGFFKPFNEFPLTNMSSIPRSDCRFPPLFSSRPKIRTFHTFVTFHFPLLVVSRLSSSRAWSNDCTTLSLFKTKQNDRNLTSPPVLSTLPPLSLSLLFQNDTKHKRTKHAYTLTR